MSQTVSIKMSRFERTPWGFRLHGGQDFGTPLLIQKVNTTSLSEAAGLLAGDILLAVNGQDITQCRHKEAQDVLVRAGNNFELTVQRGGLMNQAIPRSQTPLIKAPTTNGTSGNNPGQWGNVLDGNAAGAADNAADFTKQFMSQLTEPPVQMQQQQQQPQQQQQYQQPPQQQYQQPQQSFNGSARPQPPSGTPTKQMNGVQKPKMPASQQYNSPQPLYSEENLQEVLNQQSEILAGGVKGINFGTSEVDLSNSETLRMVQELDSRGPEPEPGIDMDPSQAPSHYKGLANKNIQSHSFKMLQRALAGGEIDFDSENEKQHENEGINSFANLRHVHAPKITDKELAAETGMPYRPPSVNGARMTPTQQLEGNSLQRARSPSPAAPVKSSSTHSVQSSASPAFGMSQHGNSYQGIPQSASQTQVGNSFQWPPQRQDEDQGATATPIYLNSNRASPAPTYRRTAPSPAPRSAPSPTPILKPTPPPPQQHVTFNHQSNGLTNGNSNHQNDQEKWSTTLESNNAGAADNAADFTKQFMSQLTGGGSVAPMYDPPSKPVLPVHQAPVLPVHQPQPPPPEPIKALTENIPALPSEPEPAAGPGQNVIAPKRGRGVLTQQKPGMRVPLCGGCESQIRGPFITALGKTWCPNHFLCSMESCGRSLQEVGFVEEKGLLYCEDCYGKFLAPDCEKCRRKIIGNCLKAMGKTFHPECFACAYCGKIFANSPFYLEDGLPYCEDDWNELFTTKCINCGFPIEAGDRWVEALNNNYHSQCFNCTLCKKNLEGKRFFVKAGKPFCKSHASRG